MEHWMMMCESHCVGCTGLHWCTHGALALGGGRDDDDGKERAAALVLVARMLLVATMRKEHSTTTVAEKTRPKQQHLPVALPLHTNFAQVLECPLEVGMADGRRRPHGSFVSLRSREMKRPRAVAVSAAVWLHTNHPAPPFLLFLCTCIYAPACCTRINITHYHKKLTRLGAGLCTLPATNAAAARLSPDHPSVRLPPTCHTVDPSSYHLTTCITNPPLPFFFVNPSFNYYNYSYYYHLFVAVLTFLFFQ
ncbi:unnamed protein product [Brassicogethes aeneus]|uniref:Uncharacterized protein n=1 Tax=Brassicogethes aeneus TaxID=1431903 RepID=A0A9P0ARE6_BRAAE|nr:unnamed protein product [Brassicogethes aeneus]